MATKDNKKKPLFESSPSIFGGLVTQDWEDKIEEMDTGNGPTSPAGTIPTKETEPLLPNKEQPTGPTTVSIKEREDVKVDKVSRVTPPDLSGVEKRVDSLVGEYSGNEEEFDQEARSVDSEFVDAVQEAQAVYQSSKDSESSKQLWTSIIHGLGHILAGVVGHQTGTAITGLKFNQPDWESRKANILRELEGAKQDAYKKMSNEQRRISEKRAERARDYNMGMDQIQMARRGILDTWDRNFRIMQEQRQREKAAKADLAALANKKPDKQKLGEYNKLLTAINSSRVSLAKKDNDEARGKLKADVTAANRLAKELGIQSLYPPAEELLAETPGMLFGTNEAEIEEIEERITEYQNKIQELAQGDRSAQPPVPPSGYRVMRHPTHGFVFQNINDPSDMRKAK